MVRILLSIIIIFKENYYTDSSNIIVHSAFHKEYVKYYLFVGIMGSLKHILTS